ncbi:transcription factor MYB1R1 isoform X1 [Vigna radiata var. radiata]|uniref:Transcription factor MYB1R1 isoform X1 n=1 Tax=Vigna radiata var. radiata TaxID=3916 RepID=A0A1S3TWX3_VIGRR|nr:transcription factor MYB1R1 isoform X1 [Vigna radiata var. radiata]
MPLSSASAAVAPHSASSAEIMLFGVRVVVDSMRKSVSMNNLSQYDHHRDTAAAKDDTVAAGYASADDAAPNNSGKNRDRKRGIPWTEEEHKLFLVGLQKVGKGDWRGISRNYVKTRTPTQVASHAQKYFLRRTNLNRRRRRSSLFDITTDSVSCVQVSTTPMEEGQIQYQDNLSLVHPVYPVTAEGSNMNGFSKLPMYSNDIGTGVMSAQAGNPMKILTLGQGNVEQNGPSTKLVCTTAPIVPDYIGSTASDITATSLSSLDPPTLSLGLSLSSSQRQTSSIHSAFHSLSCFNNGDSFITVA